MKRPHATYRCPVEVRHLRVAHHAHRRAGTVLSGFHYADENSIIPANPYHMMTYDATLGVYGQAPWYIWNGTAWVQAV